MDELHAELFGIETERNQYWASVQFSGKMREDGMVSGLHLSAKSGTWSNPVDGSRAGWSPASSRPDASTAPAKSRPRAGFFLCPTSVAQVTAQFATITP